MERPHIPVTGAQILVMENEARTAAQIQHELEQLGYSVTVVGSLAADAVAKAAETHPDLVVMDAKRRHAGDSIAAARQMRDRFGIPVAYLQLYGRGGRKRGATFLDDLRSEIEKELNITVDEVLRGRRTKGSGPLWQSAPPFASASAPVPSHEPHWLGTVLHALDEGIVATDRDGAVRFINRSAQELTGWSERVALGRPLSLVINSVPPLVPPRSPASADGNAGQPTSVERVLIRADGGRLPVEQRLSVMRAESGRAVGHVYLLRDLSERRNPATDHARPSKPPDDFSVAAALTRVGRELISALDHQDVLDRLCRATVDVLDCDYSHTVLWRAEEAAFAPVAGFGDAPEQWESIRAARVSRDAAARLLARLESDEVVQVVAATEPTPPVSVFVDHDGTTAALYVALHRDGVLIGVHAAGRRGRAEGFSREHEVVARGIAQLASCALEKVRRVDELAQANRLKSDFVATMSHELRAPLHVIMGYNDLLLTGEFGSLSAEQTTILQRVHDTARQLAEVIQTTLDWSRLETGRILLDRRTTSVHDLVAAVERETQELQQNPDVRFEWQVAADVPSLETDPGKLKVVLKNLFSNAVKFTPSGCISVSARRDDGGVEFLVDDTGIGIAPEARAMIFEPFRQVDGDGSSRGGVGLGLYIVRRILELLGGSVDVRSELGRGATFRVWVPMTFPLVPLDDRTPVRPPLKP